ncbi:unnamed protein product [Haemonchus placei]|uniref:Serpentine receptor class gamma n=1 Tax=Haemonchus placei TaxID=6290 RepID=A0A0N4WBG0_HAEPC|nr:unnamed protein product [Haemonchus placei]
MCKHGRPIEQIINNSHRWILPILHWSVPLLYSLPLFILSDAVFKSEEKLELIADQEDITLGTSMAAFFVSTTFIMCSLCYGAILRFLVKNRYSTSTAVKRETRLHVQMLGLFIGFMLFFIFNILQFAFSLYSNAWVQPSDQKLQLTYEKTRPNASTVGNSLNIMF